MRWGIAAAVLAVAGFAFWLGAEDDRERTTERSAAPRADQPAPEPEPEPEKAPKTSILYGKVTGDAPLSGVEVTAEWDGITASSRTGDDGAYEIAVPRPDGAIFPHVRADAPDGRVGFALGALGPGVARQKVGDIALEPGAGVVVRTEDQSGGALPGVRVLPHRLVAYPGTGDHRFPQRMASFVTGDDGRHALRLAHGEYRFLAFGDGHGRASVDASVDASTESIVLALPPERRLKVIVLDKETKRPVAGALVFVRERYRDYGNADCTADEHGEAFPPCLAPGDTVQVFAVAPGVPKPEEGPGFVRPRTAKPDVFELVIEIELPRTISWEVNDGDIPAPADGTRIAVRKAAGTLYDPPEEGVMDNGRLVVADCPPGTFQGIAVGPDNCGARLFCGAARDEGRPVEFRRMANVDFRVRAADGSPAPGVKLGLFNQGNNLMAEVVTDERGEGRAEALFGSLAEVHVLGEHQHQRREHLGTIDLRHGDVSIEHTLARELPFEVRVLLDGKPGLGTGQRLHFPTMSVATMEANAEDGVLSGTVVLPAGSRGRPEHEVWLTIPGYLVAHRTFALPDEGEPVRVTFELESGIGCRVVERGAKPDGMRLEFQQLRDGSWMTIDSPRIWPKRPREKHEDGWTFTGLEPGRYRMRDMRSETVLGEADVREGGANRIELDYAAIGEFAGVVVVPGGYALADVRMVAPGTTLVRSGRSIGSGTTFSVDAETGAFRIPAVTGMKKRVVVRHPRLAAVELVVTGPASGVRVELEPGASIRFRLPAWDEAHADPRQYPPIAVRLYRGAAEGHPAFQLRAERTDETWVAGGFPPGEYTLFVDVPEGAPVVRPVELAGKELDLGALPVAEAGSLVVDVDVREPFVAPRIYAWVERLDEPRHARSVNSRGEESVVVKGLLPGRYRVRAAPHMGSFVPGRTGIDEEVVIEEGGRVELELSIR